MEISVSLVEDDDGLREEFGKLIAPDRRLARAPELPQCRGSPRAPAGRIAGRPSDGHQPARDVGNRVRSPARNRCCPSFLIVMLTVYEDSDTLVRFADGGRERLSLETDAPREARRGSARISARAARRCPATSPARWSSFSIRSAGCRPRASNRWNSERLTPREQEILASLAKGHSYKEIATDCGISGGYRAQTHGRESTKSSMFTRAPQRS